MLEWPDRSDDVGETVELLARDDGGEVAVEHTRIESYPGQIDDRNAVYQYFDRGGPDLPGMGDLGGHLMLVVPAQRFARSLPHLRKRRRAGDRIAEWVRQRADNFSDPELIDGSKWLEGTDDEVPFSWTLCRLLPGNAAVVGPLKDVVQVRFARPRNLELMRSERVGVALERKLRKLHAAAETGRRSVLVLEDRDMLMSSPIEVSRAVASVSAGRVLPDVMYLLNTTMGNPLAGVLFSAGVLAHEIGDVRWEQFSVRRCGQLNAMPDTWL